MLNNLLEWFLLNDEELKEMEELQELDGFQEDGLNEEEIEDLHSQWLRDNFLNMEF